MKKILCLLAIVCAGASWHARAVEFPEKGRPIKIVVPFGAGSGGDTVARAYSVALNDAGFNAIVENRPGADAALGTAHVKNARADGHTVLYGNKSTHTLTPLLNRKLSYHPIDDFEPIAASNILYLVLNAGPSTRIASLSELLEAARNRPGHYKIGSTSSAIKINSLMLQEYGGIQLMLVPYKTLAQASMALASGEIDLLFTDPVTIEAHYSDAKVRPLAVTGVTRMKNLPHVPTFRESGIKDFEFSSWHAFFAPAGVNQQVLGKLSEIFYQAKNHAKVREAFSKNAAESFDAKPGELKDYIAKDIDNWRRNLQQIRFATE